MVEQPWLRMIEGQIAQQRKAREYAATFLAANPDLPTDARRRMTDLVSLMDEAVRSMSAMMADRA